MLTMKEQPFLAQMTALMPPIIAVTLLNIACGWWAHTAVRAGRSARSRLLRAAPALTVFIFEPLLFDKERDPFWIYAVSGIFSWWSAHKLLAFCLGRGPLPATKNQLQMTLQLLMPAAFVQVEQRPATVQGAAEERHEQTKAKELLKESGATLVSRFLFKFITAQVLAVMIGYMKFGQLEKAPTWLGQQGRHHKGPVTASKDAFPVIQHLAFDMIIYMCFSMVMDLPAGVVRLLGVDVGAAMLPHFDYPFLSLSLRELWNRRWNISAGSILRQLVYEPICDWSVDKPVDRVMESIMEQQLTMMRDDASDGPSASAVDVSDEVSAAVADGFSRSGPFAAAGLQSQPGEAGLRQRGRGGTAGSRQTAGEEPAESTSIQRKVESVPADVVKQPAPSLIAAHQQQPSAFIKTIAAVATFMMSGLQHEMIIWHCSGVAGWWGTAGHMMAFFTANGVLCVLELAMEQYLIGSSERRRKLAESSAIYRHGRRILTAFIVVGLTELFWWPPFTRTNLDGRMIREWYGWLRNAGIPLPQPPLAHVTQGASAWGGITAAAARLVGKVF